MTATLGQRLKTARELRGLSLEDAAHETRIPVQRLMQLESGNIAAFGSMTYARSFIRGYSDFLAVDANEVLEELPEGALGGERDYRYLTQSHGTWLRDREASPDRITAPASNRVKSIKSPLPTAIAVFVVILAGAAMWGKHVAELHRQVEPAAMKALPVEDDEPATPTAPSPINTVTATKLTTKHVDFPVSVRKATPVD